ncbi:winged helix-turn-helix domain-containing protein [Ornithinimicrobium panacihumi]|uniref:winged helix-turn-helix domain-containing protein n=1 Tax=Ornithinimicrobium panacihumi TaxID=2008449 RepID=UPI003F8AC158
MTGASAATPPTPAPTTPLPSSRTTARRVDVAAMKAFAHPLRMQIYRHLQEQGAATSAQLARLLGESSGQTSYHLQDPTWRWTGTRSQTIATFTAEESIALNDALSAVVEEHVEAARERHDEVSGDAGAAGLRRVQLLIHSFPLPPARTV